MSVEIVSYKLVYYEMKGDFPTLVIRGHINVIRHVATNVASLSNLFVCCVVVIVLTDNAHFYFYIYVGYKLVRLLKNH